MQSIFWDPYQKLWNDRFLRFLRKVFPSRIYGYLRKILRSLDTQLLIQAARKRKAGRVHIKEIDKLRGVHVNYFDIGTHREAIELKWVCEEFERLDIKYKAYAFEAFPSFCVEASKNFKSNDKVKFFNLALCHKIPEEGTIKLFTTQDGQGNSLYDKSQKQFVEVPVARLTDLIKSESINLDGCVNILRMNIEGAEYDVIMDLVSDAEVANKICAYYGMWDDVKKMSQEKQQEFRKILTTNGIENFTFNGRDMKSEKRKKIILEDLKSVLMAGPVAG